MRAPTEPLVTLPEALFIHTVAVRMFDTTGHGARELGAVESALHRPVASFAGVPRYPTASERAAAVWWALIKNHGFVDANKRTGTAVMHRWLDREGYRLVAPPAEQIETAVGIARGEHSVESLAEWVEARAEPLRPSAPRRRPPQRQRARRPVERGPER